MADEEESAFDEAWEILDSEASQDDGMLSFTPQSAELDEKLYKIVVLESIISGDSVEKIESDQAIEKFTLIRLSNSIKDVIDEYEDSGKRAEEAIGLMASDDVMLFFTLANEMIRSLSGEILNEEIVDESQRGESSLSSMKDLNPETQEKIIALVISVEYRTKTHH